MSVVWHIFDIRSRKEILVKTDQRAGGIPSWQLAIAVLEKVPEYMSIDSVYDINEVLYFSMLSLQADAKQDLYRQHSSSHSPLQSEIVSHLVLIVYCLVYVLFVRGCDLWFRGISNDHCMNTAVEAYAYRYITSYSCIQYTDDVAIL